LRNDLLNRSASRDGTASVLSMIAVLWPLLEKPIIRMLRA
jgi:hypothetical protein